MKLKVTLTVLPLLAGSFLWSLSQGALHADAVEASTTQVKGASTYSGPSGSGKISSGTSLTTGTEIKTGSTGAVGVQLVPGATTVSEPNTDVKIKSLTYSKSSDGVISRRIVLYLTRGSVFSSLAKKDGNSTFLVQTPKGVAAARGTDWSVSFTGDAVVVNVLDGVVSFTLPNGTVVTVPAGASYNSETNVITNLTDEQKDAIVRAIEEDGGFTLAGGGTGDDPSEYSNGKSINPSNISILPENSQSR